MEKKRSLQEKIEKMKELGIFEKWKANADARTANMYRRYNFSKEYIKAQQKKQTYRAFKRLCVPVRCTGSIIHIRLLSGRF